MAWSKKGLLRWGANVAMLGAFLVVFIYAFVDRKAMREFFAYGSYYVMLLIFGIWTSQTFLLLKDTGFSLADFLKRHWFGIVVAFSITLFVFASVQVGFKTLSDETNLLSIANSMLNNKTSYNGTMGKYYFGNLNIINNEVPKRPLMFPFLVQLVHLLTGFRYQNPFILNFIIMFAFLAGAYIAARRFLDVGSSIAAMFFVVSYPVFTIFGTSGGFDVCNSFFFMMILAAVYCYIRKPSYRLFGFIFASLLMFSNIRYESVVFLIALPLLLLSAGRLKWDYLNRASWMVFMTPLLMLPYSWQRLLKPDAYQNPGDASVLSVNSLFGNLGIFFRNLCDFDHFLPYAGILTIAGIAIFIYLFARSIIKRKTFESRQLRCGIVIAACVLLSSLMYFCHFFGIYTHPSSARFFITLSIVFALAPVLLKIVRPRWLPGKSILLISVVCFLFYHPVAVEGRFINTLTGNRKMNACMEFLAENDNRNVLILSSRPGQYVALGYGAVDFAYANRHQQILLREIGRHLFSKVFVFQEIEYGTGRPIDKNKLVPAYKLKTLYEIQITAKDFLRISEVEQPVNGFGSQ